MKLQRFEALELNGMYWCQIMYVCRLGLYASTSTIITFGVNHSMHYERERHVLDR